MKTESFSNLKLGQFLVFTSTTDKSLKDTLFLACVPTINRHGKRPEIVSVMRIGPASNFDIGTIYTASSSDRGYIFDSLEEVCGYLMSKKE